MSGPAGRRPRAPGAARERRGWGSVPEATLGACGDLVAWILAGCGTSVHTDPSGEGSQEERSVSSREAAASPVGGAGAPSGERQS